MRFECRQKLYFITIISIFFSPEAQGVVCGAVFLIIMFFFIPFPFYKHLTYTTSTDVPQKFPHHEVKYWTTTSTLTSK